jgi:hypothetical protein
MLALSQAHAVGLKNCTAFANFRSAEAIKVEFALCLVVQCIS